MKNFHITKLYLSLYYYHYIKRTESLRRVEESNQVKNLVGEFEGMANRNKARPVYPDHYTQKRSPKEGPKFIKIEKIDRSENDYQPQEKASNLSEILF